MSKFGFDKMLNKFNGLKTTLPAQVGNMAVRYFIKAFTDQAWDGAKWPARQDKKNTRPLLIGKSGGTKGGAHAHLRSSVNNSIKETTWSSIVFSVPQPYARIHNEGGTINMPARKQVIHFKGGSFSKMKSASHAQKVDVGAHVIKIPKRQFMGNSKTLNRQITEKVNEEMKKVFKKQ